MPRADGESGGSLSLQEAPPAPLTTCGQPRNLANVISMGCSFLLVFTAFQTVQSLAAKLLGGNSPFAILPALRVKGESLSL